MCFCKHRKKRKYKVDPKTGLKWYYPTKKTYTHREALKYAAKTGRRLPTKEETRDAIKSGFLKAGDKSFWASSVLRPYPGPAFYFYGSSGSVAYDYRFIGRSVRCVR